jgi:hypothetical protein
VTYQKLVEGIRPGALRLLQLLPALKRSPIGDVIKRAIIVVCDKSICEEDLLPNLRCKSVLHIGDYQPANSYHHGDNTVAARSLNISRAYLHRLLRLAEQKPLIEQNGLDLEAA